MAELIEYAILNGVDKDLTKSIEYAGGDPTSAVGVVDLASVVKSQLIAKDAIGKGIYDEWLFGSPETNYVYEEPTTSTNAAQATAIANSIKEVYDLMNNKHKSIVYVVDKLPETQKSLSALYLLRNLIEEPTSIKSPIILRDNISTMVGHVGHVTYNDNILSFFPNSDGAINAVCGWDGLNYRIDGFDKLVIETNLMTWGETGAKYSFDGVNFYKVKSDKISISKTFLIEAGIKTIERIVFSVDSVNSYTNQTSILIKDIYLEKESKYKTVYSAHHYVKEGSSVRQIDLGEIDLNIDQLFYITRSEFIDDVNRLDKYIDVIQDTLKKHLGKYLEEGSISIEDTLKDLSTKCEQLDIQLEESIKKLTAATQDTPGLMSAADKRKLDSIDTIVKEDLDNILII